MFADEMREIYRRDAGNAESAIRMRVDAHCAGMTAAEKRAFLHDLVNQFSAQPSPENHPQLADKISADILSMLLGKTTIEGSASSSEMLERVSVALNTLFSTLNRIVKTIDDTLMTQADGSKTIRSLIGSGLDEKSKGKSIEEYLGKIEKAFLQSHQAFRQAAHTIFGRILAELNPGAIAEGAEGRLKFGPMRKAEYFDIYETRFDTLQKWYESGRFMKDFLREFENNCQSSL